MGADGRPLPRGRFYDEPRVGSSCSWGSPTILGCAAAENGTATVTIMAGVSHSPRFKSRTGQQTGFSRRRVSLPIGTEGINATTSPSGINNFPVCPSSIDFGRGVVHVENPDLPCGAPVENGRVQYDSPAAPRTTAKVYLELDQFTALIREFLFVDHLLTSQILVRCNRAGSGPSRVPVRRSALPRHSEP